MSPSGKAPDFDSGIRRFESCHPSHVGARRALLRFFPRLGVFVAADRAVSAAVMRGGQDISIRPVRRYRPLPCRSETAPCCRPGMENVKNDPLAQQAEQLPFKQWVWSSNLQRVTKNRRALSRACRFLLITSSRFILHYNRAADFLESNK